MTQQHPVGQGVSVEQVRMLIRSAREPQQARGLEGDVFYLNTVFYVAQGIIEGAARNWPAFTAAAEEYAANEDSLGRPFLALIPLARRLRALTGELAITLFQWELAMMFAQVATVGRASTTRRISELPDPNGRIVQVTLPLEHVLKIGLPALRERVRSGEGVMFVEPRHHAEKMAPPPPTP